MCAFWALLELVRQLPLIGWSSNVVLAFIVPVFIVLSVFYGVRAWHGDDVRVPIVSDWLDDKMPAA
jgi:uncharacterized membrane protein